MNKIAYELGRVAAMRKAAGRESLAAEHGLNIPLGFALAGGGLGGLLGAGIGGAQNLVDGPDEDSESSRLVQLLKAMGSGGLQGAAGGALGGGIYGAGVGTGSVLEESRGNGYLGQGSAMRKKSLDLGDPFGVKKEMRDRIDRDMENLRNNPAHERVGTAAGGGIGSLAGMGLGASGGLAYEGIMNLLDEERESDYLKSMLAGAGVGGGLGWAAGAVPGHAEGARVKQELIDRLRDARRKVE